MFSICLRKVSSPFLCLLIILSPFFGPRPAAVAQTANYADMSRTAIERIDKAVALIKSNDGAQAKELIEQSKDSLTDLLAQTEQFRTTASQEHDRCMQNQNQLEKQVNDLYREQQQQAARIMEVEADLAAASTRANLSANEVSRLQNELNSTRDQIRQNHERLEELSRWWWVPGYGQYLAIRTLVDEDIQNQDRLARSLNDQIQQMQQAHGQLRDARNVILQLRRNEQQMRRVVLDLEKMEAKNRANLKQYKASSTFLTDAVTFWGQLANSLDVSGSNFVSTMKILQRRLSDRGQPIQFPGHTLQSATTFRDALLGFADSVGNKTNFLVIPGSYCGGPR